MVKENTKCIGFINVNILIRQGNTFYSYENMCFEFSLVHPWEG